MPKLDVRLIAVTQQIRSKTHVDIGSDHGGLLVSMLSSGRIEYGIAIENNRQPFENSSRALTGLPAEVRYGDGLHVLQQDEADSLSICGLGAESMLRILTAHPNRVPAHVVLQPNQKPEIVRQWALDNGYHLVDERIARGHWPYAILSFRRAEDSKAIDPAYENVSRQAALLFGPLVLKRRDRLFESQLREEETYWGRFDRLEPRRVHRLELIREVLATRISDPLANKIIGLKKEKGAVRARRSVPISPTPALDPAVNQVANSRFKFFPQLNGLEQTQWLGSSNMLFSKITDQFFSSASLQDTFLQAIAAERLLPIKEVLESFEFFARIRKSTKSKIVADLCCGHGLLGILFAMFERKVERVILIDQNESESRRKLIATALRVAPWITDKIDNRVAKIGLDDAWIEPGVAIVSAHACGSLSDLCIDIAIKSGGPIAILPCCYPRAACRAPLALQTLLGLEMAFDVDRTYRLEAADYQVRWANIPREITPMNRIIYCARRRCSNEKKRSNSITDV